MTDANSVCVKHGTTLKQDQGYSSIHNADIAQSDSLHNKNQTATHDTEIKVSLFQLQLRFVQLDSKPLNMDILYMNQLSTCFSEQEISKMFPLSHTPSLLLATKGIQWCESPHTSRESVKI